MEKDYQKCKMSCQLELKGCAYHIALFLQYAIAQHNGVRIVSIIII